MFFYFCTSSDVTYRVGNVVLCLDARGRLTIFFFFFTSYRREKCNSHYEQETTLKCRIIQEMLYIRPPQSHGRDFESYTLCASVVETSLVTAKARLAVSTERRSLQPATANYLSTAKTSFCLIHCWGCVVVVVVVVVPRCVPEKLSFCQSMNFARMKVDMNEPRKWKKMPQHTIVHFKSLK